MTPETILEQSQSNNVNIFLSSVGTIKATGDKSAIKNWLPVIREHKPEIIQHLQIEKIRAWLFKIEEPEEDHHIVIEKCENDPEALAYFVKQANVYFE